MQGKVNVYGALPKVGRLRSRVEKPSKDLTAKLRAAFQDATIEVLNNSTIEIRAKMIQKVSAFGLTYKNKQHEAQVFNLINDIFDSVFAGTNDELRALVGSEDSDDSQPAEGTDDVLEGTSSDTPEDKPAKAKAKAKGKSGKGEGKDNAAPQNDEPEDDDFAE